MNERDVEVKSRQKAQELRDVLPQSNEDLLPFTL